jgi:hypothetical protein
MNEAINALMASGFFYQMGEQIGETLAAKLKEVFIECSKPSTPAILPEIGKSYEFDSPTDELRVIGMVTAVDYPWVKVRDWGGVINLEQIAYYYERELKPRI